MSVLKKEKGFAFLKEKKNTKKASSADELINGANSGASELEQKGAKMAQVRASKAVEKEDSGEDSRAKKSTRKPYPLVMTENQRAILKEKAKQSGLSVNSYILVKLFGIN